MHRDGSTPLSVPVGVWLGTCYTLVGLLLALGLNLVSYLPTPPDWPIIGVITMQLLAFAGLVSAALYAQQQGIALRAPYPALAVAWRVLPRRVQMLLGVALLYAAVTSVLVLVQARHGLPTQRNGQYLLTKQGQVMLVSRAAYLHGQALIWRGFSGLWLVFFLLAAIIFWYTPQVRTAVAAARR